MNNNRLYMVTYRDNHNGRDSVLALNIRLDPTRDVEYTNNAYKLLDEAKNILNELFNSDGSRYYFYMIQPITKANSSLLFSYESQALKHIVYYDANVENWVSKVYSEPNMNILNIVMDYKQNIVFYGVSLRNYFNPDNIGKVSAITRQLYYTNFIHRYSLLGATDLNQLMDIVESVDNSIKTAIIVENSIPLKDILSIYNKLNYKFGVSIYIADPVRNYLATVNMYSDKFSITQ